MTPGPSPARALRVARLVLLLVVVAVVVELLRVGAGVSGSELAASWQLLDVAILEHDPLLGTWYLHTQPPLFNLVVGLIAWSPLPLAGTLFVVDVASLLVIVFGLQDLLLRWRVPVAAATVAAAVAVADPTLLSTIRIASYEVPLAAALVGLVWLLDRHLDDPTPRRLAGLVVLGVALVLTRALFHPLWLVMVGGLVLLARRPTRRQVAVVVGVPVLVIGGLIAKNAAIVASPSLSSWTGFNLQRGVLGPMAAADVAAAVRDGAVSDLATQPPWQSLEAYAPWLDGCRPQHSHPALGDPSKTVRGMEIPNFNHECFVGLYEQSRRDALTMIRRQPVHYLADRRLALVASFAILPVGIDGGPSFLGEPLPPRTWMDRLATVLMARQRVELDMRGRNIPLFGDSLPLDVGWTLAVVYLVVVTRAGLATRRCWQRRREPAGREVVWLVAGVTIVFVVVGGDLVELGENGRFRSMLDPMVVGLAAVAATDMVRRVGAGWAAQRSSGPRVGLGNLRRGGDVGDRARAVDGDPLDPPGSASPSMDR